MRFFIWLETNQSLVNHILHNAEIMFGEDSQPATRGYIYTDGNFLNLSPGVDHRAINAAFLPDGEHGLEDVNLPDELDENRLSSSYYMIAFMYYTGAIRYDVSNQYLRFSYIKKPTQRQKIAIDEIIKNYNVEEVAINQFDKNYHTIKNIEGYVWDVMDQIFSM